MKRNPFAMERRGAPVLCRFRPHALQREFIVGHGIHQSLRVHDKCVLIVVVEHVIFSHTPMLVVEHGKHPEEQAAMFQVEQPALCNYVQVCGGQLDFKGNGDAVECRAHIRTAPLPGQRTNPARLLPNRVKPPVSSQAFNYPVFHLKMKGAFLGSVVLPSVQFLLAQVPARDGRAVPVLMSMPEEEALFALCPANVDRDAAN